MNVTKAACAVAISGFVLFTVGALREVIDPLSAAREGGLMPSATAAAACPIPRLDALERNWKVVSTGCTADCTQTHLQVDDQLSFTRDVSGELNFSAAVVPGKAGRARSNTEGYALRPDGVGNVVGPIVFEHDKLDGSPLQLHWLVVKLRGYDADGLGQCKLRARVAVCTDEPAAGTSDCTALQHAGTIHLEPF